MNIPTTTSNANESHKSEFFRLWRWTLELYSLGLIAVLWISPSGFSIPGLKTRLHWDDLLDASSHVIILLFATALFSWKRHRGHSVFALILCGLWLVWTELPRL
jgi:hypothetical protein